MQSQKCIDKCSREKGEDNYLCSVRRPPPTKLSPKPLLTSPLDLSPLPLSWLHSLKDFLSPFLPSLSLFSLPLGGLGLVEIN